MHLVHCQNLQLSQVGSIYTSRKRSKSRRWPSISPRVETIHNHSLARYLRAEKRRSDSQKLMLLNEIFGLVRPHTDIRVEGVVVAERKIVKTIHLDTVNNLRDHTIAP